jgi:hypothetical protein
MANLPKPQQSLGAWLRFDLVDEVKKSPIEQADLLVVQTVSLAEEKIGEAPEHIDALVRRTVAQDFVRIVK